MLPFPDKARKSDGVGGPKERCGSVSVEHPCTFFQNSFALHPLRAAIRCMEPSHNLILVFVKVFVTQVVDGCPPWILFVYSAEECVSTANAAGAALLRTVCSHIVTYQFIGHMKTDVPYKERHLWMV